MVGTSNHFDISIVVEISVFKISKSNYIFVMIYLLEWNLRAPMIAKIWRDLPEHTREAYKVVNDFNFFSNRIFFLF